MSLNRLGALLVLGLSLGGCCCTDQQQPDNSTVSGLKATIVSATRTPQGVDIAYSLEWVAPLKVEVDSSLNVTAENLWLLEPSEPMIVQVWDRDGGLIERLGQRVELPSAFRDRSVSAHRATLSVSPPSSGESLSLALGGSGLETRRVALP